MRTAGMAGRPIGFDWPALFEMARATGVGAAPLAAFLPTIEAGVMSGLGKRDDG